MARINSADDPDSGLLYRGRKLLLIDSNNDGVIDREDERFEGFPPGKLVFLNDDDDDNLDGVRDFAAGQTGFVDDDLVPCKIELVAIPGGPANNVQWTLTFPPRLRLHEHPDKTGAAIVSGTAYNSTARPIPLTVYVEGAQASGGLGDASITLALVFGSCSVSDTVLATVVHADMNAGKEQLHAELAAIGYLPNAREQKPGAFLPVNNDDDDYDGNNTPDWTQSGPIDGENDLLPIILRRVAPVGLLGKYTLTIPAHLKVWLGPTRATRVFPSDEFDATLDTTLYVEGISKAAGELAVNWAWNPQGFQWIAPRAFPKVDRIQVTAFEWSGPLNVPGYSRYTYKAVGALPADCEWVDSSDASSMVVSGAGTTQAELLWGEGPVRGTAAFVADQDYVWGLDVNVVQIRIDQDPMTNNAVYTNGQVHQAGDGNKQLLTAPPGSDAMTAKFKVAQVAGPTVAGKVRGVKFMEMGHVHHVRDTLERGYYNGLNPPKKRVGGLENYLGGTWLWDTAAGVLPPWTSHIAARYYQPETDPDIGVVLAHPFFISDAPKEWVTDKIVFNGDTVDRSEWREFHRVYFAVRTTDTHVIDPVDVLTQRLVLYWSLTGHGSWVELTGRWNPDPANALTGDGRWAEITSGERVPIPATNQTANDLGFSFHQEQVDNWAESDQ